MGVVESSRKPLLDCHFSAILFVDVPREQMHMLYFIFDRIGVSLNFSSIKPCFVSWLIWWICGKWLLTVGFHYSEGILIKQNVSYVSETKYAECFSHGSFRFRIEDITFILQHLVIYNNTMKPAISLPFNGSYLSQCPKYDWLWWKQ